MEISKRTVEILSNYANINESIYYNPETNGNMLTTTNPTKTIHATADIDETFPVEFAIFRINEFLQALKMFEKPTLEFEEKWVHIRESGAKRGGFKYVFCNKELMIYPKKEITKPGSTYEFKLSSEQLTRIANAAKVMGVDDVIFVGDADGVHVVVSDLQNSTGNDFELTLSNESVGEFKHNFKQSNLKLISSDYDATIITKNDSRGNQLVLLWCESEDKTLRYAIAGAVQSA